MNAAIPKDIVILSEFSEIEGPIPLVAIPQQIPNDLDLNELVLQLMSTDYQNTGYDLLFYLSFPYSFFHINRGGEFRISKDTSLLLHDYSKDHHIFVHYFTLYDVRARGFVRPMCLAYITREALKLKKFYSDIKEEFTHVKKHKEIYCLISKPKFLFHRLQNILERQIFNNSGENSKTELMIYNIQKKDISLLMTIFLKMKTRYIECFTSC